MPEDLREPGRHVHQPDPGRADRHPAVQGGALLVRPAFRRFWKRVDYTEFGGAPLLGINGACIIAHGASPTRAVKNAIRTAAEWVRLDVNGHIRTALSGELVASLAEPRRSRPDDRSAASRLPRIADLPVRLAFCFPGQGSQAVGMGQALHEASPAARAIFEEADDALG